MAIEADQEANFGDELIIDNNLHDVARSEELNDSYQEGLPEKVFFVEKKSNKRQEATFTGALGFVNPSKSLHSEVASITQLLAENEESKCVKGEGEI